jgi:hypothetical protein
MSAAQKGRIVSDETREKLSTALKGRPIHTEQSRAKISQALRERAPASEETRRKISQAHLGKKRGPLSPEGLAKNREGAKKRSEAARLRRDMKVSNT